MATKYGVEYDLHRSDYTFVYDDYMFFFSSMPHLSKFMREIQMKVDWLNDSLTRRFKIPCSLPVLAAFQLYRQIETRGYLVWVFSEGRYLTCPENTILSGLKASARGSTAPCGDTTTQ